jgi:hypothetical protein
LKNDVLIGFGGHVTFRDKRLEARQRKEYLETIIATSRK